MKALDRETASLLRAVVWPRAEKSGATIAELAAKIRSWEETIEGARQHGILPTLYSDLAANPSVIPPHALKLAKKEFDSNAFHCIANAAELLEVLSEFGTAGIRAMPFKGVVLGVSLYGDLLARSAGDLDVLIHYRDLLPATRLLKERGYKLKTRVREDGSPREKHCFEYHFERSDDGMVFELRWRLELVEAGYKHDLGLDWAWPGRRTTKLAGIDVPTFDAAGGLLMLCMHGSKHVWSRLIWICDVAKQIETSPGIDWDFVQREAARVGLTHCLALGILLARRVAGAPVPAEVLRAFESDRTARRLADFLGRHAIEKTGRVPEGLPYNIQLLQFRERVAAVLSLRFLRPNERDRAVINLPRALEPLYYVIRPFRVLLDRTGR